MITSEDAKSYLDQMGIELPDLVIDALVDQAGSIQTCLDENYTSTMAKLIQVYLIGLLGLAQANKYVSSQGAPSGASRSFMFTAFADKWRAQVNLLESVDKSGCTADLIPEDPTNKAHGGIWIGKGGCL